MGFAGLAAGRFVDFREHLFEPRHVLFGFGLVLLESGFEILGLRRLRHFRQGRQDLLFREIDVFQRVVKQLLQVLLACH